MSRPGASILLPSTWPSTSHLTSWLEWDIRPAMSCPTHCTLKSLDQNLRWEHWAFALKNQKWKAIFCVCFTLFYVESFLWLSAGCVHGLVNGVWEWGTNVGPSLCLPCLHHPGAPLGLQPHLWHGGGHHHPPQLSLPQTHCFFCAARKHYRMTSDNSHWTDVSFLLL